MDQNGTYKIEGLKYLTFIGQKEISNIYKLNNENKTKSL